MLKFLDFDIVESVYCEKIIFLLKECVAVFFMLALDRILAI